MNYSHQRDSGHPFTKFGGGTCDVVGCHASQYCTSTTIPAVIDHRHRRTCSHPEVSPAFYFLRLGLGPASQNLSTPFQVPEKLPVTPCVITGPADRPAGSAGPPTGAGHKFRRPPLPGACSRRGVFTKGHWLNHRDSLGSTRSGPQFH